MLPIAVHRLSIYMRKLKEVCFLQMGSPADCLNGFTSACIGSEDALYSPHLCQQGSNARKIFCKVGAFKGMGTMLVVPCATVHFK